MAAPLHFLLLLLLSIFCLHVIVNASPPQSSYLSNSLLVPVTKHASSLQYLTRFHHTGIGTGGFVPTDLVVDLGGPFLWMDCGSSSSGRLVSSGSIQCLAAKPTMVRHDHGSKDFLKSCNLFTENRIAQVGSQGDLVQDVLAIRSTDDDVSVTSVSHNFLLTCAPKSLLSGLANGAQGMLGLGRHRISLPSQISSAFDSKWQFGLCLSSSNGVLSFGNQPRSSYLGPELSESLIYTPLLTTQSNHEYFINLQSIKINDKTLSLDKSLLSLNEEGLGGTKLSTIVPYTVMESSIYAIFYKAYEKAAMAMNMTKVPNVSPFGLCFSSKGIHETVVGPEVPAIDLVLQSKMVKWRIYGRNSMVQVSNEVMCLGFLDGGLNLKSSITLGGHQLEDVLLHFDLGTSMLGFSPSLLLKQRSCSDLNFDFMPKQSLLAKKEKDFLFPS